MGYSMFILCTYFSSFSPSIRLFFISHFMLLLTRYHSLYSSFASRYYMIDRFRRALLFPPVNSSFGWEYLDITLRSYVLLDCVTTEPPQKPSMYGKIPQKRGIFARNHIYVLRLYPPPISLPPPSPFPGVRGVQAI